MARQSYRETLRRLEAENSQLRQENSRFRHALTCIAEWRQPAARMAESPAVVPRRGLALQVTVYRFTTAALSSIKNGLTLGKRAASLDAPLEPWKAEKAHIINIATQALRDRS